jgi:hypothetical protein
MLRVEPGPPEAPQYNLDGRVLSGRVHALGVVDAVMVPGTRAFMRWEVPRRPLHAVQQQELQVAQRFLQAILHRSRLIPLLQCRAQGAVRYGSAASD